MILKQINSLLTEINIKLWKVNKYCKQWINLDKKITILVVLKVRLMKAIRFHKFHQIYHIK